MSAGAAETPQLVVLDDDLDVRDLVVDVGEDVGFRCLAAETFRELKDSCEEDEPAVIVLDLKMPDVDGIEVLRYMADVNCRAKLILMSGQDRRVLAAAAKLASARDLDVLGSLAKPFEIASLRCLLASIKPAAPPPDLTADDLRDALTRGELVLHYQPKIDLSVRGSVRLDSAEALARWQHPQRGLLGPAALIPLAERTGLIADVTDYSLRAALAQIRDWADAGTRLAVAVNFAPQLIADLTIPDRIAEFVDDYGVWPSQLILEITETAAMADASQTMDILTRLRLKGIELALDDFGTGYSSLVQLYRMPFTELKIDKSFVLNADIDEEARAIVKSIIDLGHHLGLAVCAEGVETESVLNLLQEAGCDKSQGFYFAKPMPANRFAELVASWTTD